MVVIWNKVYEDHMTKEQKNFFAPERRLCYWKGRSTITHFVFFSNFRPVVGKVYVFKRSHNEEQLIEIDLLWNRRAF